jgi:nitroreductase/NAD-dependent dihydropyrimidine dehydrogenase PreA subunit
MPDISIDQERCTRCEACVAVCTSARVFELSDTAAHAVRPSECWLCGHCVAVCPVDAVQHSEYPLEEGPPVESPPSYEGLVTAFRERRSLRVFRDEPVPRGTVRELVDVSRWVPSASNQQPVDWIALDDPAQIARLSEEVVTTLARTVQLLRIRILRPLLMLVYGRAKIRDAVEAADDFEKLVDAQARGQDPIFHHAPVVLAAHVPQAAFFGRDDAVYAVYNLMLAAERLGLGTCHIGYVNAALERSQRIPRILGLPPGRRLEVVLTLGYPRFKFRRAIPRRRMELLWNPPARDE